MDVSSQIYQLERITYASDTSDSVLQKYHSYYMRIVNSKVSSQLMDDAAIQNELARLQSSWPKQKSLRFQELMTRLVRSKILKQRNAALQFLFKLGSLKEAKPVETIFKPRQDLTLGSSLKDNTQQMSAMKKSLMEIENGLAATLQNNGDQFRPKPIEVSHFQKTVKQITDKGNEQHHLKEFDLVCDCLYAFQGIEGHNIIYDVQSDGFMLKRDVPVSLPTRKLVNQLCEIGWLYRKIATFLKEQSYSLIQQALQNGLREELNEYYRLIAILENMLQQEVKADGMSNLTLRKLFLWIKNPLTHFTNLGVLVSLISHPQQLQGQTPPPANMISTLVSLSLHGCQTTHQLYSRLLSSTCVPFVRFINQWVFEGIIDSQEFFVEREEKLHSKEAGELWKKEFQIRQDRVPAIIRTADVQLIFDTGRVVNWIHRQCQLKNWQLDNQPCVVEQLLQGIEQQNQPQQQQQSFNAWITQANTRANNKLIELIFKHFQFQTHLQAIKRYLLLGQGEFIHALMEAVQNELTKPAMTIHKHNLIGLLEGAIRSSNVQYLPQEIQLRLDVRLLDPAQGDTGWEIFSLDYKLEEPLNTILNQKAMLNYLRIFNFLWRVKRVEFTIAQIWKLHQKAKPSKKEDVAYRKTEQLGQFIRNEMQHFIANFYNYIMLEAVESAWTKFNDELGNAKDLDTVIRVHEQFQSDILDRAFMTPKSEQIYRQILKVFDLIFRFKYIQEVLIQNSSDFSDKNQEENQISMRLQQSAFTNQSFNSSKFLYQANPAQKLKETHKLLTDLHKEYKTSISELLDRLKRDEKLKFLSFRLDFNEYYYKLSNEAQFNVDLDKFVGMYIQQPGTNNQDKSEAGNRLSSNYLAQSNISITSQANPLKKLSTTIQQTKPANLSNTSQSRQNIKPQIQNLVQPVFQQILNPVPIQQTLPANLIQSGKIRSQAEQLSEKSVQQGLKLLEEQRKTNQQLAMLAKQKFTSKIEEEAPATQNSLNMFRITKEEHERMKNDDDSDKESSMEDAEINDDQFDDDDDDDQ